MSGNKDFMKKLEGMIKTAQDPEAERLRQDILNKIRGGQISLMEVTPDVWEWLNASPKTRFKREDIIKTPQEEDPLKKHKEMFPERFGKPTGSLEEKVRERENGMLADDEFTEEVATTVEEDLDEDVTEEIGSTVSENDFGPAVDEEDMEEVVSEVSESDALPSDEEMSEELDKEESFEDEERLAGLADDVEIDDEEDAKDKDKEEKDPDEWNGKSGNVMLFLGGRRDRVPPHKGSLLGCQRAHAFLKTLLDTLSRAIRGDIKGEIDEDQAEGFRVKLLQDMAALDGRVKVLSEKKYASEEVEVKKEAKINECDKCGSLLWKDAEGKSECLICGGMGEIKKEDLPGLDKSGDREGGDTDKEATAQIPQFIVTPFVDAITSILINAKVSAGKNMEDVFQKLAKKFDINDREKLEIVHVLMNKGYPITPIDRGRIGEGNYDQTSEDGVDWLPNYFG